MIHALIQINDRQATLLGLQHSAPDVRRGALIALDQMDDGRLTRELVTPLLDTSDMPLLRAALDAITHHPTWAKEVVGLLDDWLAAAQMTEHEMAMARGALIGFRDDKSVQSLVTHRLQNARTSPAAKILLLDAIAQSSPLELSTLLRPLSHNDVLPPSD